MAWKRLEASTLALNLDEALSADIADPLWMLGRQWQVGELQGEDAGRPTVCNLEARSMPVGTYLPESAGANPVALSKAPPLETLVEQESARDGAGGARLAAEAGLQFLRRLQTEAGVPVTARGQLVKAYPLAASTAPANERQTAQMALLARRAPDGRSLAAALAAGKDVATNLAAGLRLAGATATAARAVAKSWLAAWGDSLREPTGPSAWSSERLDYRFSVGAPNHANGMVLGASAWGGGRLDWQAFDFVKPKTGWTRVDAVNVPSTKVTGTTPLPPKELLPTPLRYAGMPAARWWDFEDNAVHFGDLQHGPEDLARTVVAAFATVYGDDWFVLPLDAPVGGLVQITKLTVRDEFGTTFTIDPIAAKDHAAGARPWKFLEISGDSAPAGGQSPWVYLAPVLADSQSGKPLEEVAFVRDEAANLGWAVERVVESAAGDRYDRRVASARAAERVRAEEGEWQYKLASPVPPYQLPLLPVRITGGVAIRLQRGRVALPEGGTSGALGRILEPEHRLLIREEALPACGLRLQRGYELARGPDGRVHLWVSREKRLGKGEVKATVAFDTLKPG